MSGPTRPQPLYEKVKTALKEEIAAGRHDPARPFITQRELCARFGVSNITAVRALNDLVAEGVLIRRRGQGTFVAPTPPSAVGAGESAGTVACIVNGLHGLRGAHVAHILTAVEKVSAELGYQLVLSNSAESPEREDGALRRAIRNRASAIVLYPVQGQQHPESFAEVRRAGIPLVMIDRYRPDVATDAVVADNTDLGYQLTVTLVDRGHDRIATLWGETECTSVQDRLAGHLRALRDRGLPVDPELSVLQAYEPMAPDDRLDRLRTLLDGEQPPTVLLCANGYVLATVAHDLLTLGVAFPDQVELACMDDAGPYELLPLAALEGVLPSAEMAAAAVRLVAERIASGKPYGRAPRRVVLPIGVRERDDRPGQLGAVSPNH